jgi:hypothetical protein
MCIGHGQATATILERLEIDADKGVRWLRLQHSSFSGGGR